MSKRYNTKIENIKILSEENEFIKKTSFSLSNMVGGQRQKLQSEFNQSNNLRNETKIQYKLDSSLWKLYEK